MKIFYGQTLVLVSALVLPRVIYQEDLLYVLLVGDAAGEQDPGLGPVVPGADRTLTPHDVRDLADDLELLVIDAVLCTIT